MRDLIWEIKIGLTRLAKSKASFGDFARRSTLRRAKPQENNTEVGQTLAACRLIAYECINFWQARKSYKKNFYKGFSLIELVVAFTIFIVLGTVLLTSQQQSRRSSAIRLATDSTQSALRQMQNNILSGELYSANTPARDYGIKLVSNGMSYESFTEEAVTVNYKSLETYNFAPNLILGNLQVISGGSTQDATAVDIRFFPPFGEIRVTARNGGATLFTEQKNVIVTFRLSYSGTSQYRQIIVDGLSGRISEF